jgi:hypothetical protein
MQPKHNKQLVSLAKQPRKEMTKEEQCLWYDFPRSYPVRFSRQKVLGKYISLISIAQKQNPSLSRTFLNTMRIEASKKMQAAPLFWRGMA